MALQLNTGYSDDNIQIYSNISREIQPQLFQAPKVFDQKNNWLMSSVRTNGGQTERNKDLVRICSEKIIVSFHTPLKRNVKRRLVLKILLNNLRQPDLRAGTSQQGNVAVSSSLISVDWRVQSEEFPVSCSPGPDKSLA